MQELLDSSEASAMLNNLSQPNSKRRAAPSILCTQHFVRLALHRGQLLVLAAKVDAAHLAVFAVWPTCPCCDAAAAMTFGRDGSSLVQFGGQCSCLARCGASSQSTFKLKLRLRPLLGLEDSDGKVIYQVGGKAQCGNCGNAA